MSKKNNHKYYGNKMNQNAQKPQDSEKGPEVENQEVESVTPEEVAPEEVTPEEVSAEADADIKDACSDAEKKVAELEQQVEKEKKEYLFLMAEFDNFRKRTLKEKSEIIKNAGEKVFKGLLPIVDDMERGIKASEDATDVQTVREGLVLIYNKLVKFMEANGVKAYDENDDAFDAERHEAITAVPVEDESRKGKILDTIEKGYTINDKVLRHARVVVGQ